MEFLSEEQIDIFIEEVKLRTKQEVYCLLINKDKTPDIFDSKFGGLPYWDLTKDYPTDNNGNKLMLLAQINLDRVDTDNRLPQNGMLQFFIACDDDLYGCDLDNQDIQNMFRVVYHDKINYDVSEKEIKALKLPVSTDDTDALIPVESECAVDVVKAECSMGLSDYRFEELAYQIFKDKFGIDYDIKCDSFWDYLDEDAYDKLADAIPAMGNRIFGYPFFTQTDPREYKEDYQYYDTLLLQMDSEMVDGKDYVLWGDCGVGNFFINHKDLENRDFSKVMYNCDCL